ncbi:hypothetical protein D3C80_1872950 [compost metagenome]
MGGEPKFESAPAALFVQKLLVLTQHSLWISCLRLDFLLQYPSSVLYPKRDAIVSLPCGVSADAISGNYGDRGSSQRGVVRQNWL